MRAPGSEWAVLIKLLPVDTDLAWFATEFARIKDWGPAELNKQRLLYLDQMRLCDEALAKLPLVRDRDAIIAHLVGCKAQVDSLTRQRRQWKARRYIELLILAKRAGVRLGYSSVPKPHGPGIAYLQAAAAGLGASISSHSARRLLRLYSRPQPSDAFLLGSSTMSIDTFVVDASGQAVER